jgi:hypothetical protein
MGSNEQATQSRRSLQSSTGGFERLLIKWVRTKLGRSTTACPLTNWNRVYTPPPRKQICTKDTYVQRQSKGAGPPPNNIANEVDLLLVLILRPETNTSQEERPVYGGTCVRM